MATAAKRFQKFLRSFFPKSDLSRSFSLTDKSKFEAFGIQESDVCVWVDADGDDIRLFCKSGGETMENDLFLWIGGVLVEVF